MAVPGEGIQLQDGKKIYFASDFHFGIPDQTQSREREKRVCSWLDKIGTDAQQLYLLGDLFDVWMEYKRAVPKGGVRFLGKLAELSDAGIDLILFTGNHDLWMHGYLEDELGARVYKAPQTFQLGSHRFHVGHGDGLIPEEKSYLRLKNLFHHPLSQFLYRQLHPDTGLKLADYFSRLGPKHKYQELQLKPLEQEYQWIYASRYLQEAAVDYFIFGHRHIPYDLSLREGSRILNTGDWISYDTYVAYDGTDCSLRKN